MSGFGFRLDSQGRLTPSHQLPVLKFYPECPLITRQTLPDGTHYQPKASDDIFIQRLTRSDIQQRPVGPPDANVRVLEINDAGAGFRYVLDADSELVHRTAPFPDSN